jgi:pyruvate-ferredoxin/flavodoxin oxidoreductase
MSSRPFPEAAIINALRGKKNVIILERTDEGLAGDNPLARDIRVALGKALEVQKFGGELPALTPDQTPRIFRGAYGIGSRDFRPEHTLGAYEFAIGQTRRKDGRGAADGETYFVLGVDHPYAVISKDTPSLLPDKAIAVRFHSIGGWGMITTGKNLGSIIGDFGSLISEQDPKYDATGQRVEKLFVMANPKYGSEKKGAPTNYYLTVAPEPIQVNCELNHVDVVLCCDPKAFTHTNPLEGLNKGGCIVWESSDTPETAWQRIPAQHRKFVRDNNIRVYILPGFEIARKATNRGDLQLRMQGNSFLGAFFRVSPFLKHNNISDETFLATVKHQYEKKFGRFGEAVVASNMLVMEQGFSRVQEIKYGDFEAPDHSSMRNPPVRPVGDFPMTPTAGCGTGCGTAHAAPAAQTPRYAFQTLAKFDSEFRNGLAYHQPAGALASVGVMGAGSGATQSKYVARRETPVYIAENCTQCMECITACPDTALPNTSQDVSTVLKTAAHYYVTDAAERGKLIPELKGVEDRVRAAMVAAVEAKQKTPFMDLVRKEIRRDDHSSRKTIRRHY